MVANVFYTLSFEFRNQLGILDEVFQLLVNTFIIGQYIDDGAQMFLVQNLVVFGFSSSYTDDSSCHGLQRSQGLHSL